MATKREKATTKVVASDAPVAKKAIKPIIDYQAIMNKVESERGLTATELNKEVYRKWAVSTGILMLDLMLGGGIMPAWNLIWGGEGAAKTTTVESISANIMATEIPIFHYWDYEQALDVEKFSNICATINPGSSYDKIFGVRNLKNPNKFDVAPMIRYYPHDVGEDFYLTVGRLLRDIPDKLYRNGTWYYVFERTKANQKIVGSSYDKELLRLTNKYWVEAPDGGRMQGIFIVDSIQAMNPEAQEVDDPSKQLAQDAAMHAKHLKKVRSKLRKKHCGVLVIGQMRHNPGARFQSPEYTSGGNALKHASDIRQKNASRSSPNGKGAQEQEASVLVDGAIDTYKYIHAKNEKNKFFTPNTEGWFRFWIDHEGQARGFDPVYDCYQFLRCTGRIVDHYGCDKGQIIQKFVIHWPENGFNMCKITWLDFKALVLFGIFKNREGMVELCENYDIRLDGELHNPKMRERCFEDMRTGRAFEAFQQIRVGIYGEEVADDEDVDEDDEDDEEFDDYDDDEDED